MRRSALSHRPIRPALARFICAHSAAAPTRDLEEGAGDAHANASVATGVINYKFAGVDTRPLPAWAASDQAAYSRTSGEG